MENDTPAARAGGKRSATSLAWAIGDDTEDSMALGVLFCDTPRGRFVVSRPLDERPGWFILGETVWIDAETHEAAKAAAQTAFALPQEEFDRRKRASWGLRRPLRLVSGDVAEAREGRRRVGKTADLPDGVARAIIEIADEPEFGIGRVE
ncbi:hypothetical protein FP2506_01185 [Fulvimarina pelagi HTCC2506]|uniref:Uncharacterized protein n=1 Tax=Fulvimarina pelagi HTCC2506 TaxID=314231 RepID=Q0G260_9HYPH|nr:hypothetical protein [Fulvimarina pelagi]EAU41338.1 hypothetical protein FP2506_01185 [Fulvimarina pelagi HTCC2506]